MCNIQKFASKYWLVLTLASLMGLLSMPSFAQDDPEFPSVQIIVGTPTPGGTIPSARQLYLPLIQKQGSNDATPTTVPNATPTAQGSNPRCLNPGAFYGFGPNERWQREDVGCGWKLLPGDPITITVPINHFMTTSFGGKAYRFCQGVTIVVSEGTLWQMGSNEPMCTSDSTPTPTATNTPEPTATLEATATPTMTPSPTATATQPAAWKWQDSITVLSGVPNVVACGNEQSCYKWNMYVQGPTQPIRATMHCTTQGSYIDANGVEKYGLQSGVTYEKLTGFTVRDCN